MPGPNLKKPPNAKTGVGSTMFRKANETKKRTALAIKKAKRPRCVLGNRLARRGGSPKRRDFVHRQVRGRGTRIKEEKTEFYARIGHVRGLAGLTWEGLRCAKRDRKRQQKREKERDRGERGAVGKKGIPAIHLYGRGYRMGPECPSQKGTKGADRKGSSLQYAEKGKVHLG